MTNTEMARKLILYAQVKAKTENPAVYDPSGVLEDKATELRRQLIQMGADPSLLDQSGADLEVLIHNSVHEGLLTHRIAEAE